MAVTQGSIGFVGINTAGTDWLAFVTLADLAAGDTIYFSDNELATAGATSFNAGESYTKWVAPTGGTVAGTVVVLNSFDTTIAATNGTASAVTFAGSANRGLSGTADSVYAYTAASDATADTPTLFLTRINIGNAEDGVAPASVPAAQQISFTTGVDSVYFTGPRAGQAAFSDYLPLVNAPANYTTVAGASLSSVLSTTAFTVTPAVPPGTNNPEAITGSAGPDTINALAGDDTIAGAGGNDSINGGAGRDVAIFEGNRADATILNTGLGSWTVTTVAGGTDTLAQVEILQFADGQYGGATLLQQSQINLSLYQLAGRYDLPEPTRTTAPANSVLAQEVSGVAYNPDTDTLFVVGDGGTSVVQVSKTGALINSMTLATGSSPQGTEFYDPEGITYVGGGRFVMTEERDRQLVQFTYVPDTVLTRAAAQTVKLGTSIGNIGFEGLSYDPQTSGFIVVKEITPESIFQTTVDFAAGTASNGSPTATASTDLFNPALLGLSDIADVYALSNLVALNGQAQSGNLLVLSQEAGRIVNVDRAGNITSSLTIVSNPGNPLSVPNQQHEGLTVGADGTLYVVSENGGGDFDHPQLWVYKPSLVANLAPTALALSNPVATLVENTNTDSRIKVADVAITDDGIGSNTLTLSGADAAFFEVDTNGLYIKAGTALDFEAKPSYAVTVNLDDVSVGATPDVTATYSLTLTDVIIENPAAPVLFISEVAAWGSGNAPYAADWFEITNSGATAIDITGWRFDDSSNVFAQAVTLNGITSIAAGESVIFLETADLATTGANFLSTWFGASPPAGLRLGSYSGGGVGLSTGGDAVNLFNAAGVAQTGVTFGASPTGPFATFNNAAGASGTAITTLSAVGVNRAGAAVNDAAEIGSPGTVGRLFISEVAPWSSGNSPVAADWFEVTNDTGRAIDITGWKMDDNSGSAAAAVALSGITSIAAGESVIFLETATLATTRASFIATWFGGNPPAGLQIGAYSGAGVGLGNGGDAVNLYNATNVLQASLAFGAAPTGPFASFDNAAGLNGTTATVAALSVAGTNGAFAAAADAAEIASPGSIRANPALIVGNAGSQSLAGGAGAETINGADGNDTIDGGAGNDTLDGGTGGDTASYASATADLKVTLLLPGTPQNTLGAGTDTLTNFENLTGGAGNDALGGNDAANLIDGGAGNDQLFAEAGPDTLLGGAGNDTLYGGAGNDSLAGGAGDDVYQVTDVLDVVAETAGEGTDIAFVTTDGWTQGPNIEISYLYGAATGITGSAGDDTLVANASLGSSLAGGLGQDVLWGQAGNDTLLGGAGHDVMRAQGGNDLLNGGLGNDQQVGGAGADVFAFDATGWGYDQIFDFNAVEGDKLDFRGSGLSFGQLVIYQTQGSSVVANGADRIDVYGVASLSASDFIFA